MEEDDINSLEGEEGEEEELEDPEDEVTGDFDLDEDAEDK